MLQKIQWEPIRVNSRRSVNGCRKGMVYLTKNNKAKYHSRLYVTADIVEEAGLMPGDAVEFLRNGGLIMMRKCEPHVDSLRLRKASKTKTEGVTLLTLTNQDLCLTIKAYTKATEFEAWVDEGCVIFRAKTGDNKLEK